MPATRIPATSATASSTLRCNTSRKKNTKAFNATRWVDADTARRNSPAFQLLFDPQTAGGLLAAVPKPHEPVLDALKDAGISAACIGEVTDSPGQVRIV
mgnify:CR=1 FL=1